MTVVDAHLRPQVQAKLPRRAAPLFSGAAQKIRSAKPTSRNQFPGNVAAYLNNLEKHRGQGDILDQLLATSVGGPMYTGGRGCMQQLIQQARQFLGGSAPASPQQARLSTAIAPAIPRPEDIFAASQAGKPYSFGGFGDAGHGGHRQPDRSGRVAYRKGTPATSSAKVGMMVWIAQAIIEGGDADISVHVSREGAAKAIRALFKDEGLAVPDIPADDGAHCDGGYIGADSSWFVYLVAISP
jgi:hypothetical protein